MPVKRSARRGSNDIQQVTTMSNTGHRAPPGIDLRTTSSTAARGHPGYDPLMRFPGPSIPHSLSVAQGPPIKPVKQYPGQSSRILRSERIHLEALPRQVAPHRGIARRRYPPTPRARSQSHHTQQHVHHLGRVSSSSRSPGPDTPIQAIVKQQGLQHKAHAMAAIGWDDWLLDRFPGGHPDGLYRRLAVADGAPWSWELSSASVSAAASGSGSALRAFRQSSQAMPGLPRQWAARSRIKSLRRRLLSGSSPSGSAAPSCHHPPDGTARVFYPEDPPTVATRGPAAGH